MKKCSIVFLICSYFIHAMEEEPIQSPLLYWFVKNAIEKCVYVSNNLEYKFALWEYVRALSPNLQEIKKINQEYRYMLPSFACYKLIETEYVSNNKVIDQIINLLLIIQECKYVSRSIGHAACTIYKTFLKNHIIYVYPTDPQWFVFEDKKSYFCYSIILALTYFSKLLLKKGCKSVPQAKLVSDMLVGYCIDAIERKEYIWNITEQSIVGVFVTSALKGRLFSCCSRMEGTQRCAFKECNRTRKAFIAIVAQWLQKVNMLRTTQSTVEFELVKWVHHSALCLVLPKWFVQAGKAHNINFFLDAEDVSGRYTLKATPITELHVEGEKKEQIIFILSQERFFLDKPCVVQTDTGSDFFDQYN